MIERLKKSSGARYFAAGLVELGADYVLTLALYHLFPLSLSVAAGISFFAVGIAFYFVHEFWTFREEASAFSTRRMAANFGVLCLAGAVRVALIALLEHFRPPAGIWVSVYFAIGVAGSFTTNYLMNRYVVFRR